MTLLLLVHRIKRTKTYKLTGYLIQLPVATSSEWFFNFMDSLPLSSYKSDPKKFYTDFLKVMDGWMDGWMDKWMDGWMDK